MKQLALKHPAILTIAYAATGLVSLGEITVANLGETNRTTDASTVMLSGTVTGGAVDEVGFGWGPTDGGAALGAWANVVKGKLRTGGEVRAYISAEGANYYRCYAKAGEAVFYAPLSSRFVVDKDVSKETVYAQSIAASMADEASFKQGKDPRERYSIEFVNDLFTYAHDAEWLRRMQPKTWDEWFELCNGIIVDPPVSFIVTNPVPRDAGSLLGSFKFFTHAAYFNQSNDLASVCDSRSPYFQRHSYRGPNPLDSSTRCLIFMTTSYTHRAETFRGIFYRLENEAAPMSPLHDVCYDYVVFRLSNGEYWQTDDVSGLPVGMVRLGRGKLVWSQGSWSNLVQKLQQTDFPPSFYAMPIP